MDKDWDVTKELKHFEGIWEYRRPTHFQHTKELWNERAHEWAEELNQEQYKQKTDRRVKAATDYLRSKGILGEQDDVIDIGCGPGRFVAEFARTAHHAVGTDFSSRMLEYGARYAEELAVREKTSWVECDFKKADLDALGWRNRFDLVFSSITPAISGLDGLERLMQMSRGWCFNSCFVHSGDGLVNGLCRELFGLKEPAGFNGHWHWYYALFNLLWLQGYYPETTYYKECWSESVKADRETAKRLAGTLARDLSKKEEELREPIYRYLQKEAGDKDTICVEKECTYGFILWDMRKHTGR